MKGFLPNFVRFFFLSIIHPKKVSWELQQADFWFKETTLAHWRAENAQTKEELDVHRAQFDLAVKRYYQHRKYIMPYE